MATEKKTEGFGDTIGEITKKLGIDQTAQKIAKSLGKRDCGCKKRQEGLNDPSLLVNRVFYGKNKIKKK